MQLIMPLLRADFQACQTYDYVHEPPLDCPLTVFGGLQDEDLTHSELEDWCGQTTSSCTVRMLPGDHFFINTAQSPILRMVVDSSRPGHVKTSAELLASKVILFTLGFSPVLEGVYQLKTVSTALCLKSRMSAKGAEYESQGQARARRPWYYSSP